ncbi:GNAT family N-acetyltransferase [Paenibacillus sp. UMB4589-SE434]|uniref:GNAT family N-acetyltransferase n=1 Tax=Paenibacillus sp. UMB4589-SE434 TaxID=3046314 RepID=UPI0025517066|nr:GNAT family N-acetyltransferase [Paenibacillus sp. UMB4589-SE434]MDK8179627.1 GNAT family N-acetyltransferase [Paenibacillus sp. UMB4589-SE434]
MLELQANQFKVVESFFMNKKSCIPALSVIYGNYPGRVFVDDEQTPQIAIVWATGRWMYLEGSLSTKHNKVDVSRFLQHIVIPDCKQRNENWFEIYTSDDKAWNYFFEKEIAFLKVNKHYESVYALNLNKFAPVKRQVKVVEEPIKIDLVHFDILPQSFYAFPYVRDEFKAKKCIGVEVKKDNQLITVCKNNGFIVGNEYFIDVDTFAKEERGKGYATVAAIRLMDHLLEQQMYPLWETTHENIPSHKLAVRLGFEKVENYPVYSFNLEI